MIKIFSNEKEFNLTRFKNEAELERIVVKNSSQIFGNDTYYFDLKKGIQHKKGDLLTIPDGYLLKLNDIPSLAIVENEMFNHDNYRHIAMQFTKFHAALTPTSKYSIKKFLIEYLKNNSDEEQKIEHKLKNTNFKSITSLLDDVIMEKELQYVMVIDKTDDELERILSLWKPSIYVIKKFQCEDEIFYQIDFDDDEISIQSESKKHPMRKNPEMDTIVCPARENGLTVFLDEHRWFAIKIRNRRIKKIKYMALYESKPISAIRYVGEVKEIKPYKNTNRYEIVLKEVPFKINPIKLTRKFPNLAPQSPKYTIKSLIDQASKLEDIFGK